MTAAVQTTHDPMSALTLVRPASPALLLQHHEEVTALIEQCLKKGVDYGVIPGTGTKQSLLKPGAERLNVAFGAVPEYEIYEKEVDHDRTFPWLKKTKRWNNRTKDDKSFEWITEEGTSVGLYRFVVKCRIVRGGRVLGEALGACSSMESKYIDRPRDCENTCLKMAQKRAMIGATLHAYGLSDRFSPDKDAPAKGTAPPSSPAPAAEHPHHAGGKPYTGSPFDRDILNATLKSRHVPDDVWGEISTRMMGHPISELDAVIAAVKAATP